MARLTNGIPLFTCVPLGASGATKPKFTLELPGGPPSAPAVVSGGARPLAEGSTGTIPIPAGASLAGPGEQKPEEKMTGFNEGSGTGKSEMLGSKGTQTTSSTVWKDGKGGRLDVENPNPGQRPGQIHYQNGYQKYIYDPIRKEFKAEPGQNVPREVQDLLKDSNFVKAIDKGMRYLGE